MTDPSSAVLAVEESPVFLRVAIILQAVALFLTSITAGLLLTAPSGRVLHSASAYSVFAAGLVHLIAVILVWRRGGGAGRPVLYSAGFFVLVLAQIALGIAQAVTLHLPLGVLLFGYSVLQLSQLPSVRRLAPETV
ncbi:hypothetical protein ACIBHY_24010 [Nonomuraea sp. NPDC050547]|uniref:hypothetical protein n=1 Tax=unclassified Nonomuraea TaxID=2593643 RepID=UPI003787EBD9